MGSHERREGGGSLIFAGIRESPVAMGDPPTASTLTEPQPYGEPGRLSSSESSPTVRP
jgi:hypothetical protein